MKSIINRYLIIIILINALLLPSYSYGSEEEKENEGPDFFFLIEEAYTQEEEELQIDFSWGLSNNLKEVEIEEDEIEKVTIDEWSLELAIEYGFTERFQIEVEIPYSSGDISIAEFEIEADGDISQDGEFSQHRISGIGDIEIAATYALLHPEDSDIALSAGIELTLPTGDYKRALGSDTLGWGSFLSIAGKVSENLFLLGNAGIEMVNNGKEASGLEVDETEYAYGIAAAYKASEELGLILELAGSHEKEKSEEGHESTRSLYLAPGLYYDLGNNILLGFSVPIGLSRDSYDWSSILKVSYEY